MIIVTLRQPIELQLPDGRIRDASALIAASEHKGRGDRTYVLQRVMTNLYGGGWCIEDAVGTVTINEAIIAATQEVPEADTK